MEDKVNPSGSTGSRIFYGWWIVVLGALIQAVGAGILVHSFTVFFLPLKRDLGVSRAAVSLLFGAARLEGGAEGPLVGYLIDRFGPRLLLVIGACLAGIGLILLSTVRSYLAFFLIYVLIVSVGSNAGFFHPVSAAVNNWFIRRRGICFAIITASGNVGGMVMAPVLSYLILGFGWRIAAIIAGSIILIVALPAAARIHRSPEVRGLYPDGRPPSQDDVGSRDPVSHSATPEVHLTVKEALRTLTFWLLSLGITLRILVTMGLTIHLVPILVWKGMDEVTSAYLVSLFAFSNIVTMLTMGWLGDRWNKALLCGAGALASIVAMLALVFVRSTATLYAFPIGLALTMGTNPLNWALIGDLFGRRSYATLRGIMGIGYGFSTFLSPIYAGWIFDQTGSYTIALFTFSFILLIAAFCFYRLRHRAPGKGVTV